MSGFNWNGVSTTTPSILPDDTMAIDYVLDKAIVSKIYELWDESSMQALVDYGGGVKAITALMVREAGVEFLTLIKGVGPKRADEIMASVTDVVVEVPYL